MTPEQPENENVLSFEDARKKREQKSSEDRDAQTAYDELQALLKEWHAPSTEHIPLASGQETADFTNSIHADQERMWRVVRRLEQATERDKRLEEEARNLAEDLEHTIALLGSWGEKNSLEEFQRIRATLLERVRDYIERFTSV
jgi:hypothetical protein